MASFKFRPFSKKQKKALSWWMDGSPKNDQDILLADGSVRSGKTVSMINGFVDWSLEEFDNENFILAGKSMGALTKNVLNPLKKMLTTKGLSYYHVRSTAEPRIEIGSNDYYLYGANNISSKDTLTGLTAAGSYADQAALFPENFINTMIDRCSITGSRHWWNCNPQGPKHFIKKEYIDKAEQKNVFRLKFNLDDNLTLSESIKNRYKRLHSGVWYARYIEGKWIMAEGLVYDIFDEGQHVVSDLPDNFKQFWIGSDYGTANPTVFLLIGLSPDNKFYVIDEWRYGGGGEAKKSKTDQEYSEALQDFLHEKADELGKNNFYLKPKWIWVDPSAASFIQQLWHDRDTCQSLKRVKEAKNEVLDGIRRLSTLISLGKLKVHQRCSGLIEEFHSYVWDQNAQEKGEDKPVKENDHAADALRYGINGIYDKHYRLYKRIVSG